MKQIRTGDLYLANRWSVQSLLAKTADEETIWSEAGIFVVDNTDPEEADIYVYFVDQQVEKVLLSDLLAEGNVQAAAHRSLIGANHDNAFKIAEFLRGAENMDSLVVEVSSAIAIPIQDGSRVTSSGITVDNNGRSPTHVSKSKRGYTSTDLVASTLASAGRVIYNPELALSDLHHGATLDAIYGPENPLLASSKPDRDLIIQLAQAEVAAYIDHYMEQIPQVTLSTVRTSRDARRPFGRSFLAKAARVDSEIPMTAPVYLEQYSMPPLQGANRGAANQKAEDELTKSMDRRLRKQAEDLSKFPKPQPGFRK